MRAILCVLLVSAVALAGCSGEVADKLDNPDEALENPDEYYADHYCVKEDVEPRVLAPDASGTPWEIGDYWTYSLKVDGVDHGITKLVYYSDQDLVNGVPQHYMVGTSTRSEALEHAIFSINPVLGRIHQTLYSPHEKGSHADMFHFPLCEGSTWAPQSSFFERQFSYTATASHEVLPNGVNDDIFQIDGIASDGSTVRHTYSPDAKWFTAINLDRADGLRVEMKLVDFGTDESGSAFFLRGQQDAVHDLEGLTGTIQIGRAHQDGTTYETVGVFIDLTGTTGDRRVQVDLVSPSGESVACVGRAGTGIGSGGELDAGCSAEPIMLEAPFEVGNWQVRITPGGVTGTYNLAGEFRLVSIDDRSCVVGGACLA